MLRPPKGEGLKGSKSSKVAPKGRVREKRKVVGPNDKEDDEDPPANMNRRIATFQTPQTPQTLQTPQTPQTLSNQASSKSESGTSAAAPVGADYSSNCSKLLPRSQVLSLLQWDCHHSMRRIKLLVLHCSDTRPDQNFSIEKLMASHKARGFGQFPGYHIYIRRDGTLYYCRPVAEKGCHVKDFNSQSIGICYEGGRSLSADVRFEDNRTAEQMQAIDEVLQILHAHYPEARIVGHHELNPRKACPCLSPPASVEYAYIFGEPNGA